MTRKRQTKSRGASTPRGRRGQDATSGETGAGDAAQVAAADVALDAETETQLPSAVDAEAGAGDASDVASEQASDALEANEPDEADETSNEAVDTNETVEAVEAVETNEGDETSASAVDEGDPDLAGSGTVSAVGLVMDDDEEIELTPRDRPGLEKAPPLPTGEGHLKGILESLLFVTDRPLPAHRLAKIARASSREVQRLLDVLTGEYRGRGIELVEVAGGYQFRSSAENAPFVRELVARKPVRLTRAQIETLSIMAYRQPITRPEIDEVRGVDSGSALKVLLDKGLVRIIGRKEEPGRPLLYGTTPYFLEFFGLPSLSELPTLREYSELSDESRALFQRRTGEAIDQIGDLGVEARHYSEDEVEAEEAQAARRLHGDEELEGEAEPASEPAAQGELPLDEAGAPEATDADAEPVAQEDAVDDEEDEDDEDDEEDEEDEDGDEE